MGPNPKRKRGFKKAINVDWLLYFSCQETKLARNQARIPELAMILEPEQCIHRWRKYKEVVCTLEAQP